MSSRSIFFQITDTALDAGEFNPRKLEEILGFKWERVGSNWILYGDDPALQRGPADFFHTVERGLALSPINYERIADTYIEHYLAEEFEQQYKPGKLDITIPGDLGVFTDVAFARARTFFPTKDKLKDELVTNVLPAMREKFGARHVFPVRLEGKRQQGYASAYKILHLTSKYGALKTKELVLEKHALDSVLPMSHEVFVYLECVLASNPIMYALPLHRMGSALYFLANKPMLIRQPANANLFELLLRAPDPLSAEGIPGESLLGPSKGLSGTRSWFLVAVQAANNIVRYVSDPRNFVSSGKFQAENLLNAYAATFLMAADVQALNYSKAAYPKQRLAFSFFDKLANLIWGLAGRPSGVKDEDIFRNLLSESFGQTIAGILRYKLRPYNSDVANAVFGGVVKAFTSLHVATNRHLQGQGNEARRLDLLRTMRNTIHGTFLRGGAFETHFHIGAPVVPVDLTWLPHPIIFAFMLDPNRVREAALKFQP